MQLLFRGKEFWSNFEYAVLEVIALAIEIFKNKPVSAIKEDDLNRVFYFCLVSANYELQKNNRGLESPPFYEGNNQPSIDDEGRTSRESKRPDFQWTITDISEPLAEKSPKQFVLECKRIGDPVGSWILNKNYINHGIKRFIDKDYGYGYGVPSSAMLGYIQGMSYQEILKEINEELLRLNLPSLKQKNTEELLFSHDLKKEFPLSWIELIHFWIESKE